MPKVNKCNSCSFMEQCDRVNYIGSKEDKQDDHCNPKLAWLYLYDGKSKKLMSRLDPGIFGIQNNGEALPLIDAPPLPTLDNIFEEDIFSSSFEKNVEV